MGNLIKRSDKLAFYGVSDGNNTKYMRMTGFTDMSISKNPKEYTRQYIDEEFEQSDVVGFSPSISFTFDAYSDNEVHNDIMEISNKELTGSDAIREIIIVDVANVSGESKYKAIKRTFAVIPDSEGNGTEAYQCSGTFKVKGEKVFGCATSNDDWASCEFELEDNELPEVEIEL